MNDLLKELRLTNPDMTLSGMVRSGLVAFWPHITAYLKARPKSDLATDQLVTLVLICAKAREHGVTAEQIEQHLDETIAAALAPAN